jgi:hypothetical protein
MKCRYEYEVRAQCPVNPTDTDLYAFVIESESLIEVEKIVAFFKDRAGQTQVFLYLELPVSTPHPNPGFPQEVRGPFMHRPGDDDSAAVTFWGKRDLRDVLRKMLAELDRHYTARGHG